MDFDRVTRYLFAPGVQSGFELLPGLDLAGIFDQQLEYHVLASRQLNKLIMEIDLLTDRIQ